MPKKCFNHLNEPTQDRAGQSTAGRFLSTFSALKLVTAVLIALIFVERPLHAYADPGSGLLAWQLLGAVIIGAAYQIRRITVKLKGFFASRARALPTAPPAPPAGAVSKTELSAKAAAAGQGGSSQGATVSGAAHDSLFLS
jgi:hypothetical protein